MEFDLERVRQNVLQSNTEDLLDRITVYRDGMECEAIGLIERELFERGVTSEQILLHAHERRQQGVISHEGAATMCSLCRRPAVVERLGWHKLWGIVPVFPRRFWYCAVHSGRLQLLNEEIW